MDKTRPRQWTATGEPKVSRVSRIVGEKLTRPQIAAALTNDANNAARAKSSTSSTKPLRARARKAPADPKHAKPPPKADPDPPLEEPEIPSAKSFLERARHPHRRDLTVEQVVAALTATGGARAAAAQRLGVTRSAITHFVNRHPEVADAIEEIRGTFVDLSEAALIKAARAGEGWAVRYMLDNHGSELGYGRKVTLRGDPAHPIQHQSQEAYDYSKLTREEKRTMLDLLRKSQTADADPS